MKNIKIILLLLSLLGISFSMCSEEETKYRYEVILSVLGDSAYQDTCYYSDGWCFNKDAISLQMEKIDINGKSKNLYKVFYKDGIGRIPIYRSFDPIIILDTKIYEKK